MNSRSLNPQDQAGHFDRVSNRLEISSLRLILVFSLLMAAGYTWISLAATYQMGHDQTYVGTMLAKDRDPSLYARDYAFHDDTLYRSYIPVYRWLLETLIRLTGSFDHALLSLVPVAVFLFTLGTALLLLDWSRSLWLALVLTFLAIPYRPAPSGELWGVGGVEFMLARTLATSLAPFTFMLFFRFLRQPSGRLAACSGGAAGLLAFLHPPTALFLGELFFGLTFLVHFRDRRVWLPLALMAAGFLVTAVFPLTFMEAQAPPPAANLDFNALRQVICSYLKIPTDWGHFPGDPTERRVWLFLGAGLTLGLNYLLRPGNRLRAGLQGWGWGNLVILYICWRLAGKGAGFSWLYLVAAVYVVWRYRRQDLETEDWWLLAMGVVVLAISVLPYYFLTLLWLKLDSLWLTSLVVEHYRAVRLVHPFFYLFSARAAQYLIPQAARLLNSTHKAVLLEYSLLALTMFSRLLFGLAWLAIGLWEGWRLRPQWRRTLATGLLGLTVLAGSGLVFFPALRNSLGTALVRDLGIAKCTVDMTADEQLYSWAKTQTPKDALFFYGSPLFRFRAQRSITHALGDLINHREARYVDIFRRYRRLEQAYADPAALLREAEALQADYLVVDKTKPVRLPLPLAFENEKFLVYALPPAHAEAPPQSPARPFSSWSADKSLSAGFDRPTLLRYDSYA